MIERVRARLPDLRLVAVDRIEEHSIGEPQSGITIFERTSRMLFQRLFSGSMIGTAEF